MDNFDIEYYDDGTIMCEEFYDDDDKLHREKENGEDQPAVIEYYSSNIIKEKIYYCHGIRHRDKSSEGLDQPAYIFYDKNGMIVFQDYYMNGELYATIDRDEEGKIKLENLVQDKNK